MQLYNLVTIINCEKIKPSFISPIIPNTHNMVVQNKIAKYRDLKNCYVVGLEADVVTGEGARCLKDQRSG